MKTLSTDRAEAWLPFRYVKNPYHLFFDCMVKISGNQMQKTHAAAIGLHDATFASYLKQDYVDLGDESAAKHRSAIQKINKTLSDALKTPVDVTSPKRSVIESRYNYSYPVTDHEKFVDPTFGALRGIWQVFTPSHRLEDVQANRSVVRVSYFLFFGFRPDPLKKDFVDLLWTGNTTAWKGTAQAEIGTNILYVYAQECATRERKMFSFYAPGLHDRKITLSRQRLEGVSAGTVLDQAYESNYPATASFCVSRKLVGWSNWFKRNDILVDAAFVSNLKNELELGLACGGYYPLEQLQSMPQTHTAEKDDTSEDRNKECTSELDSILRPLCDENRIRSSLLVGREATRELYSEPKIRRPNSLTG